jgi:TolB protein
MAVITLSVVGMALAQTGGEIEDCPGALPSRLTAGDDGFLGTSDPRPVNVRSGPGLEYPVIDQIRTLESFRVLEGPVCAGFAWLRIFYRGGLEGWIAEGGNDYYVEPLSTQSVSWGQIPTQVVPIDATPTIIPNTLAPTLDLTLVSTETGTPTITATTLEPTEAPSTSTPTIEPTLAASATPATGAEIGDIVFVSFRDGNQEIYSMNRDGSNVQRLTDNPADDLAPQWSPDGTEIAFTSNRSGNYDLWVMNADGSDLRQLTDTTVQDYIVAWSPDGSQIGFLAEGAAFIIDLERASVDPTEESAITAWRTNLSPDGTMMVGDRFTRGNWEIFVSNADGSESRNLTNNADGDNNPRWSPDGTLIVFESNRDGDSEIFVMEPDGSNPVNLTNNTVADISPEWRPVVPEE